MAPILTCKSLNVTHQKLPLHRRMDVGVAGHIKKGTLGGVQAGPRGGLALKIYKKLCLGFIQAILEWPALEWPAQALKSWPLKKGLNSVTMESLKACSTQD